jgi:hypothetical protein
MQDRSAERRIAKTGSIGDAELRMITMTADFRKRHRRSMRVSINRGENKIIRRVGAFFNQLKPGLLKLGVIATCAISSRVRHAARRESAALKVCDKYISQTRAAPRTLVSFASETIGNVLRKVDSR